MPVFLLFSVIYKEKEQKSDNRHAVFPSQQDSINGDLLSTMEIQQLIRQCQQGDAEALGALYQTYAQRMRGVCRRYICPPPLSYGNR